MDRVRVALIVSHPIQHFCPQYASLAKNSLIEFKVFFASTLGYKKYIDPNFKKEISWSNLYLDRFSHEFLNGEEMLLSDKHIDAPSLEERLELFDADVIITYGYFQKLQRRAHSWAGKNRVPIAYISDAENRQKRNPIKQYLKKLIIPQYFKKINFFLTVGDANEAYYKKYKVAASKFIRMHYSIDVNTYETSFEKKNQLKQLIREQYSISADTIVLSVVGKLVEWKNQDHIIDALILLEKQDINVELFIIGSGEKQETWEAKAKVLKKSRVHFTGFINAHELPAYYAATDIYIHPASVEPHSLAISEAIYMGCPIIISDRCGSYGPTDDVQHLMNGFVYKFGNIQELADYINRMLKDKNLRESFSVYSHKLGVKFQHISHVGMIEKLIKEVKNK